MIIPITITTTIIKTIIIIIKITVNDKTKKLNELRAL